MTAGHQRVGVGLVVFWVVSITNPPRLYRYQRVGQANETLHNGQFGSNERCSAHKLLMKCRFFVAGNGIDKPARRATQADALHEYYMNSANCPGTSLRFERAVARSQSPTSFNTFTPSRLLYRPSQAAARQPTNRATRSLLPRRITTDVAHRRKPPPQYLQSPFDFGDFGCKTHPQPILNVHQSFH